MTCQLVNVLHTVHLFSPMRLNLKLTPPLRSSVVDHFHGFYIFHMERGIYFFFLNCFIYTISYILNTH